MAAQVQAQARLALKRFRAQLSWVEAREQGWPQAQVVPPVFRLCFHTSRVPPNTWDAKGCDGCPVSPEPAATHASTCGLHCGNSSCVGGSRTSLSHWHLKCACRSHGSTIGSRRWSGLADSQLLLVLGPLSSRLLLLHGHLFALERHALFLSPSCSLSLSSLSSASSSTHESVLVLLLKINGP